jgi:glycosyltransferase involved in cell wall biosynthesis
LTQLSVVIPVYGCAGGLRELHRRLTASLQTVTSEYEIVLVDDRSRDGAWPIMLALADEDPRLRILRLSRNFGQHAAITAGLSRATGARVVVMDCDLQEPPELIPALYAKALEGYDVVRTAREGHQHRPWRRVASRSYRSLFMQADRGVAYSTLSLISRKVVDVFLSLPERDREYQLVLDWLGFDQAVVSFAHAQRGDDSPSTYGVRQLLRVAFDGLFFRTTVPLRIIVLIGFMTAVAGALFALYAIASRSESPQGYTSLVVLLLLLCGMILVCMGVVGLYVGRIFDQVKGRPLFIVDDELPPKAGD